MEAVIFSEDDVRDMAGHFDALTALVPLRPISSKQEYDEAVVVLNALLDRPESSEGGPLAPLLIALGEFIGDYEDAHHAWSDMPAHIALRELMNMHNLKQTDLPEIGSQGVISEILNGKRELNTRQIANLARRFHISPAVFFPA